MRAHPALLEFADAGEELLDVVVHDVMVQALHPDAGARRLVLHPSTCRGGREGGKQNAEY